VSLRKVKGPWFLQEEGIGQWGKFLPLSANIDKENKTYFSN